MTNVFVYGTLKKGHGNNWLLGASPLLGEALSIHEYDLYDGGFPYAVHISNSGTGGTTKIWGEIYTVNDYVLKQLDGLEGHPNWYERFVRPFNLFTGEPVEAWIYEYPKDLDRVACPIVKVDGEIYRKWR